MVQKFTSEFPYALLSNREDLLEGDSDEINEEYEDEVIMTPQMTSKSISSHHCVHIQTFTAKPNHTKFQIN